MKILLIGNLSDTIVLFREKLIRELIKKNITVYTLTMDSNQENFNIIASYGAKPDSYSFFSRSGTNPFSDIWDTYKLNKKKKKIKPDVVLSFFPKTCYLWFFSC